MGNLRQYTCERVSRGYAQAVEQARWPGGQTGLGWAVADDRAVGHGGHELGLPDQRKSPASR